MKIITWNCRKGRLKEKYKLIQRLKPDVLIVPEADDVDLPGMTARDWIPPSGQNKHHGLGIYTFNQYGLKKTKIGTNHWGLYLPVSVYQGKDHVCNVVGYWTKPPKDGGRSYMGGFIEAVERYSKFIKSKPTIVAGDLNSLYGLQPEILTKTEELGLIDAYYEFNNMPINGEKHKSESSYHHLFGRPTNKHGKPYLLDHVFIPLTWRRKLEFVKIGTIATDRARESGDSAKSDHRPVITEIDLDFDLNTNVWL